MNKKISIAVGVAAAVAFTGTAMANNTQTVNSSEGYVDLSIAAAFVPEFVTADCSSPIGGNTGNCNDHGAVAAGNAAGTTIVFAGGGTEANAGVFANPDMIVVLDNAVWTAGVQHSAWTNAAPFSSGLMSFDRSDGSSYFAGLTNAWTGYDDAAAKGEFAMGAPIMSDGSEAVREEWVDQTVVGYIESRTTPITGGINYEQNFRSQLSWVGSNVATAAAHIDQRLEQDLSLDDGGLAFEASRQTLQTAFAVDSGPNATTDVEIGEGSTAGGGIGQLVTQDVEGWFYSCLNCDSTTNAVSHAFTPFETSLTFMPYTNTWRDLPSISHGASGGNLSTYATAPGQVGP